jgi:hypothetical protein
MSETLTAPTETTPAPETPAPHPWDAPQPPDAPADPTPAAQTPEPSQPSAEPEQTPAAEPEQPKPRPADRRIAQLAQRYAAEAAARAEAERRAEAAEALLQARAAQPESAPTPQPASRETVEQAAARLVAQREFETKRAAIVERGWATVGKEAWTEATDVLTAMGAMANPAFYQTLVEMPTETATRLVQHLSQETGQIAELLNRTPLGIAREMGRMAAEIGRPAPRAAISNAPRPLAPTRPTAVVPEPSILDDNLSMAEWNAAFEKSELGKKLLRRRW